MKITSEQRELLRLAILQVLDANRTRFGFGLVAIAFHLAAFNFTPAMFGGAEAMREALAEDVEYLTGKQMVEEVRKQISRENRTWRITRQGTAFVDEKGL